MSDPRVFFAAERTLLAWVRTGLTVMGFGFVVARFGLFLKLLAIQHVAGESAIHASPFSSLVGITLVVVGSLTLIATAWQQSYVAIIPQKRRKTFRRFTAPGCRRRWRTFSARSASRWRCIWRCRA